MPKHGLKIKEKAEILTQENCQKQGNHLKRGPLTPLVNVTVYIFPCPHQYPNTVRQVIFMGNLTLIYPAHFEDVPCQSGVNYIFEG